MSTSKAPSPLRKADYESIEAALLQSTRGRWFLAEYTRLNHSADTRMLLDAITKLKASVMRPREDAQKNHVRRDLLEMAEAISKTRSEINAMRSAEVDDCKFNSATEELDAIVEATEMATSDILTAAEDIQETAWLLRENGGAKESCDKLDAHATDIYTACSFQDLTGQRISKVVQTLRFLENRVLAMIDIWGLDDLDKRGRTPEAENAKCQLLNGPAPKSEGIGQSQVDHEIDFENNPGKSIEGESEPQAKSDASEPAAAQTPPLTGEVEASAFSAPAELDIDKLGETKAQALFN